MADDNDLREIRADVRELRADQSELKVSMASLSAQTTGLRELMDAGFLRMQEGFVRVERSIADVAKASKERINGLDEEFHETKKVLHARIDAQGEKLEAELKPIRNLYLKVIGALVLLGAVISAVLKWFSP